MSNIFNFLFLLLLLLLVHLLLLILLILLLLFYFVELFFWQSGEKQENVIFISANRDFLTDLFLSGITDFQRGQLKSACLKLQPIKLTVLFNSAWAELSNTNCTMSVHRPWYQTGFRVQLCTPVHWGIKEWAGTITLPVSGWWLQRQHCLSRANVPNQLGNVNPLGEGGKSGMNKF